MLQKLLRRRPLHVKLTPTVGKIYAHLFQNRLTGLDRNLFWNLRIELEPLGWDGGNGIAPSRSSG